MADITNEHNVRHHVEALVRASVKALAKIPRKETRAELRSAIEGLRKNADIAIGDGRVIDAAMFLADFGRRALGWAAQDLPRASDYSEDEKAQDDAILAEAAIGPEPSDPPAAR
jgi:hypothetical protein